MSNNEPNYNELFFEPELSWEGQKKWMKEFAKFHHLDYREHDDNADICTIVVWKNGDISVSLFKIVKEVPYHKQREIIKILFG